MSAVAYYNEIDPFAAQWLRELIRAGHIAYGDVDERDIRDIPPRELTPYTQCHFFAGIGVWSYALRRAGWPDDRPVWTGSCPCQPFSAAGRGEGFADERHLWPHWFHLIGVARPRIVFGEQVASKDGLAWLDLVQSDLEGTGYAVAPIDLCAAGVGAPHIRQRLWFVADAKSYYRGLPEQPNGRSDTKPIGCGKISELADAHSAASDKGRPLGSRRDPRSHALEGAGLGGGVGARGVVNAASEQVGLPGRARIERSTDRVMGDADDARPQRWGGRVEASPDQLASRSSSVVNGFWRDADFIPCQDEKWRPVEPGTFPLAHGAPARVGRLRGYGNAINAEAAKEFIAAAMQVL